MSYLKIAGQVLLFICLLCIADSTYAQIRPGIKFGVSTPHVDPGDIVASDEQGHLYHIFVERARYGVHGGIFIQMQLGHFFVQPEALYNSTSVDYKITSLGIDSIFRDSYRDIDFPVVLGLKTGPLRIGGGPVAHLQLARETGFSGYEGFEPLFEDLTWGWQAGVGLDFWKLHIDVRYEGNFSKLGDHISFFGERFDFDTNNNRLIGSIGFSF
jgi:hypothetical protein